MRSLQPNFANGATQMLRPAGKSQEFRNTQESLISSVFYAVFDQLILERSSFQKSGGR
jgi:hypothetical protein